MKSKNPANAGSNHWFMLFWLLLGPLPLLLVLAFQARQAPVKLQKAETIGSQPQAVAIAASPKPADTARAKQVPVRQGAKKPAKTVRKADTEGEYPRSR